MYCTVMKGAVVWAVSHVRLQYQLHGAWFLWLFTSAFLLSLFFFQSTCSSPSPDLLTQTWARSENNNIVSCTYRFRQPYSVNICALTHCFHYIPPIFPFCFSPALTHAVYIIDYPLYFSISVLKDLPLRPTCLLPHLSALIWRPAAHISEPGRHGHET